MTKTDIRKAVDKGIAIRAEKAGMDADATIREIALIASSDLSDYVRVDPNGAVTVTPLNELKPGKSKAIRKVRVKGDTIEIELYDKIKSLELLSRHLGLLHDRAEIGLDIATVELILSALPPAYAEAVRVKLLKKSDVPSE